MVKKNACIFISGKGTNLNNILNKSIEYTFPIHVKLIVCSSRYAKGLVFAKQRSIPFFIIQNNLISQMKLINEINKRNISIICLAGFMKILSKSFIRAINLKILNIHPSLLPKFKGLNTYERIKKNKEKKTGCTVHFVNEKLDSGKIILRKYFYISPNDDFKVLKYNTQKLEYLAYPEAIYKLFRYN
tara:strand:+ start:95 stop:655 length:561 start_codon:yes stop_codon:yes gene_type:complete